MKLTFLGTGSAFTTDNYQSNILLESGKSKLLVDCGSDIRFSLKDKKLSYLDIDNIYISHLHADHAGGLEYIGFSKYFDPRCSKPNLFISDCIVDDLWNNTLSGGMRSIQGLKANLNTYFNVVPVSKNGSFKFGNIDFQLVQTVHIMDGFSIISSFGLMFKINNKTIYITTDTQFCPEQIKDFYDMSDVIFQDCETTEYCSGVHANFQQLITLSQRFKNKMWLYHYQPGELPEAELNGFLGFVKKGQVFEF